MCYSIEYTVNFQDFPDLGVGRVRVTNYFISTEVRVGGEIPISLQL